jgi:plasmid maintenance system antidote protein VapI
MLPKNRRPIHPGEILREEYLEPLQMTQEQLARSLGITRLRVNEIREAEKINCPYLRRIFFDAQGDGSFA